MSSGTLRPAKLIGDVFSPFYVVAIWKIRAKVAAAALLPAQCGARNHEPDADDASHAPELAVGGARSRGAANQGVPRFESCNRRLHSSAITEKTAVPPHHRAYIVR